MATGLRGEGRFRQTLHKIRKNQARLKFVRKSKVLELVFVVLVKRSPSRSFLLPSRRAGSVFIREESDAENCDRHFHYDAIASFSSVPAAMKDSANTVLKGKQ